MTSILDGHGWLIPDLLLHEECCKLTAASDEPMFLKSYGASDESSGRHCFRRVLNNQELAATLESRINAFCPKEFDSWTYRGVCDEFRLIRYEPGQFFGAHVDACRGLGRSENQTHQTHLTLMVYLNETFVGGDLVFDSMSFRLTPTTGLGCMFFQDKACLLHHAEAVTEGTKWILRGDVAYTREVDSESSEDEVYWDPSLLEQTGSATEATDSDSDFN
eukprot:TRINITY_DN33082_c0_g1_i1.p1 TRINITY_DN33082_c0_g1~~TRINITY_DN33082_c0_g1_i1.p1  ORF type:complete len:219 (-),score=26.75 TRINITY_DN33082_c0_g1_i1:153-809(-)